MFICFAFLRLWMLHIFIFFLEDLEADMEPVSHLLKAVGYLNPTLKCLQNMAIFFVHKSRTVMLFIKLLLCRSPSLHSITIKVSAACDAQLRLGIAKEVKKKTL